MRRRITAVIVTFNRKALLLRGLEAVAAQTRAADRILIVDNASTDGTIDSLRSYGWLDRPDVEHVALEDNTGGAGGFAAGMAQAVRSGADWVWIMDDDAVPHARALERLDALDLDEGTIYGSVAVAGERLSWPMVPHPGGARDTIWFTHALKPLQSVQFLPFLGLMVSRAMIERIGVPDAGFFLAADDVDYCFRARRAGAEIVLMGDSRIEHPPSERYRIWLPGRPFYSLRLAPWKRYYDVRNRILVARTHYGLATYYQTVPASFLRLLGAMVYERHRWQQLWAFFAGMTDGLLGRKGRRHEKWGLRR